ncbi:TetR/AcrR family transcriptional regulator [Oceanispirochaeta sp.]|jgi:AcrR family transcriptional regulator|uniref:TetR/AcrR family transcriptional regulator n=1 Tax=Oceanispirochaeta sp. TaxID=2035350 RepID=UPI002629FD8B|nr:TetR/AcrR family transcriptional regulator [Oceanispirochaeta sp.]MDA3958354.1 TetR/AcrR family transcriptional regulator [Oceanispirochaeta sp.]
MEILKASEELFMEKGFAKTTIGDIAAACELTNGALYLYFRNKNEIILIIMTRISRSFGELLHQTDDPSLTGIERAAALLGSYRRTFRDFHSYHVLDAQFNVMFDRKYPESPYLQDYFEANHRVLSILRDVFESGFGDGTIRVPRMEKEVSPGETAGMFLNVLNSYVEKLSLRKELMEHEQGISLEKELDRFIDFMVESIRAC